MIKFRTLGLVVLVGMGALFAGNATADPSATMVNGHVHDEAVSGPGCESPVGFCTSGELTGGIQGHLDFTVTSLTPVGPPGVLAFTAVSTISTAAGDIHCADSGSFNTAPGSDGEGVHLCVVTGGTGQYAGASGYLQERFTFMGTTGVGRYTGKIVTGS
jgi:hypothetical protein